jgi:hypothetical protein
MGLSDASNQDRHHRNRKDVKNLDSDDSNHHRKKRHGDRSSRRRRHRKDDDAEGEERRPRRHSHDSDEKKHGSKNSSSKNIPRDKHNSKRHKNERENVRDDRRIRREGEHRKHSRRHSGDDDERRSFDDSRDAKRQKRRRDDDDDKQQRKSRKHKHLSHRHHEREELPRATTKLQVNKSDLFPLGDKLGHPPDTLLDPENDYFEQNQRFRLYLYRECGMTFDDLSSAEARKTFHEFVQRYNAGELEMGYYSATLPLEAVEQCPSTRHQWSLKLSNQDSQNLQMVQKGIRKQNEFQAHASTDTADNSSTVQLRTSVAPRANPTSLPLSDQANDVGPRSNRTNDRARNRQLREESQSLMEDFTGGRAEGRDRLTEKRQERASQIHGANKHAPEVELDDATLYGGGSSDDFRRALAESQKRAAAQEAKKQARIEELQRKEEEKKSAMLQMLGLSHKIGQSRIKIAPRNDPSDES